MTFDEHDAVGRARSLRAWWRRYLDKHDFLPPPQEPQIIEKTGFRVAVLGDWGTSMYGAPVCAATIAASNPSYDILFHLGDVYYARTPPEVETRFINLWPAVPKAISRATNSNHEM